MSVNAARKSASGITGLADRNVQSVPWLRHKQPANDAETASLEAVAASEFIAAMSRAVSGVSVVTTAGSAGRWGLTVSAVTSVSAEPPQLLVCINRRNPLRSALISNGVFAVNMLSAAQCQVADTFAGRVSNGRPFDFGCAQWQTAESGSPLLRDASAVFDCVLRQSYAAGTHTICIGQVVATRSRDAAPLLYTGRRYGWPRNLPSA